MFTKRHIGMIMNENLMANSAISLIACAFSKINEFSRSLRSSKRFINPITSTDISVYKDGWHCEKYVESVINHKTEMTAVWCIDISFATDTWNIVVNTSISYGDYDNDIAELKASSIEDLGTKLEDVINILYQSSGEGASFMKEIDSRR